MKTRILTMVTCLMLGAWVGVDPTDAQEEIFPLENGSDALLGRRPSYAQGWMSYGERLDVLEAELTRYRRQTGRSACDACQCGCGDGGCGRDACPGLFLSAEYLSWKPRRRGLDFAISDPDDQFLTNTLEGKVESLELESNGGLRTTIGYLTASGWDVAFTYTNFHSSDSRFVREPAGGSLWATRVLPDGFENNQADSAAAAASLNMDVFDLEMGRWLDPSDSTSVRFFMGIRSAIIDQDFSVDYAGGNIGNYPVRQSVGMQSVGLRVGGSAHWYLSDYLSIFGGGSGSVLVGDFGTVYEEDNGQQVSVTDDYFQSVPAIDVATGLNLDFHSLTVQVGYEFSTWFNVSERVNFNDERGIIGEFNPSVFSNGSNDLGIDGFFVKLVYVR